MDFSYELETQGISIERSYAKPAIGVGAEKTFKINAFDITIEACGSIPLSNTPNIYTAGAGIKYWFVEHSNVGLEVQYFYLDYEDDQDLANHLRLEMQPVICALSLGR
jgi:hypothetical protein